jgi:hypothetical protein
MSGARPLKGVQHFTRMALSQGFVAGAHLSNLNRWAVSRIRQRSERWALCGTWAGMVWSRTVALFGNQMGPAYGKNMFAIAHPSVNGRVVINKQFSAPLKTEGAA